MIELVFSVGVSLLAVLLVLVIRSLGRLEAEVKQVAKQLYGWRVEQRGD